MLLAEAPVKFLPPFTPELGFGLLAGVLVAALVLRWLLGSANPVARRGVLWVLRGAVLALVALILVNPVRVDESPGPIQRPEMFYLLDASASMQMGNPRSRWDESLSDRPGGAGVGHVFAGDRQAVPLWPASGGHRASGANRPLAGGRSPGRLGRKRRRRGATRGSPSPPPTATPAWRPR